MAELEHYGMKERRASHKDANGAAIGEPASPAKAAEAAEPARPATSASADESIQRTPQASLLRKCSLSEAFGEEDEVFSAATKDHPTSSSTDQPTNQEKSDECPPARDPFEPAPPTPDSIVTNVMATPVYATPSTTETQSEGSPFAPQTSAGVGDTYSNVDTTQNATSAPSAAVGYESTYNAAHSAYQQAPYSQPTAQTYAQAASYAAGPTPAYSTYDYSTDPYSPYGAVPQRSEGKVVAALACGVLSLVLFWTTVPGIILGIVAIALAGSYADLWGKSGKTTAAKVAGIIGIVASTLVLAFSLLSFALFTLAEEQPYVINGSTTNSSEGSSFLDVLPLDNLGNIVTGKDSSGVPLSGQERAAAEAAMDALQEIPKDTTLLTSLSTNADDYFADMNGGIRLKDIGLSGADVVRWLVDNMQCSVANDGVFITDDTTAMVFIDASAPTMWTYIDAATQSFEQKYGEAEMDTEKEYLDALGDSYKTASTTAEVEDKYLSLNLTNRNGTWVVDSDSLLQQAQYLFDLWS